VARGTAFCSIVRICRMTYAKTAIGQNPTVSSMDRTLDGTKSPCHGRCPAVISVPMMRSKGLIAWTCLIKKHASRQFLKHKESPAVHKTACIHTSSQSLCFDKKVIKRLQLSAGFGPERLTNRGHVPCLFRYEVEG
jgi:hypothetical protein